MTDPLFSNDSNSYNLPIEAMLDSSTDYETMSLKELNALVDTEILADTLADILSMPACMRSAAIADFEEIDPLLGAKLRLEVLLALD